MSSTVLFIFEGIRPEKHIYEIVKKYFLQDIKGKSIVVYYEADIYYFGKKLLADPDQEFFELLKEHNPNSILDTIIYEDISEIYLFFDYDIHATLSSDITISELLKIFNNETETGKLYISYPMSEAIKDYCSIEISNCEYCKISKEESVNFKSIVDKKTEIKNIKKITYDEFKSIINYNLIKTNCLINRNCSRPSYREYVHFSQEIIHAKQIGLLENIQEGKMMILSGFVFFILDYFDDQYYNKI